MYALSSHVTFLKLMEVLSALFPSLSYIYSTWWNDIQVCWLSTHLTLIVLKAVLIGHDLTINDCISL